MKFLLLAILLAKSISADAAGLTIQHLSASQSSPTNIVQPRLRITNSSELLEDLRNRTLSWDILEADVQADALVGECWYVSRGACADIGFDAEAIPLEQDGTRGRNLRVRIKLPSVTLEPGGFLELQWGFHEQGWRHQFDETDDWSFTLANGLWNPAPRVGIDDAILPGRVSGMVWMGSASELPEVTGATPGQVYKVGPETWVRGASDWELVTQTIQGARGEPGPMGPQGEPGPAGVSPDLTAILTAIQRIQEDNLALRAENAQIRSQLRAAQAILSNFSKSGNELVLSGVNLRIVDGSGRTASTLGLGNLFLGYDRAPSAGSHNIVIGENQANGYGAIITGSDNLTNGAFAAVLAGTNITIRGKNNVVLAGVDHSVVSDGSVLIAGENHDIVDGGSNVLINGQANRTASNSIGATILGGSQTSVGYSSFSFGIGAIGIGGHKNHVSRDGIVVGGESNVSEGNASLILGGKDNRTANSTSATLIGGTNNRGSGTGSLALGGSNNEVTDEAIAIGGEHGKTRDQGSVSLGGEGNFVGRGSLALGGVRNEITGDDAMAVGGAENTVRGDHSIVLGGRKNTTETMAEYAQVLGGESNHATSPYGIALGGTQNVAEGVSSLVAGGDQNRATEWNSSAFGGRFNRSSGVYSTTGGGLGTTEARESGWSAGGLVSP